MGAMIGSRSLRLLLPMACVLVWSSAAWAANPYLERARKQLDDLKYDEAASSLEQALRQGESGPKELAEIYQLSAQVAAARGDDAAAEDYFKHLLALAPETRLPAGVSPKIAAPFENARAFIDQRLPISVRWEKDPSGPAVRVLVDADPLSMVHGAEVIWTEDGAPKRVTKSGTAPFEVTVPSKKKLAVRIAAIDDFGNRIAEFGTQRKPLVIDTSGDGELIGKPGGDDGGPAEADDDSGERPVFAKWWLWGGVAVVAAGAGTYFGLDVVKAKDQIEELNRRTQDPEDPVQYSEAQAIQKRGERSAILANVTFGVAGAAAVAAVILYVTEPKGARTPAVDQAKAKRESRLMPALGSGQVGVVWTGSF